MTEWVTTWATYSGPTNGTSDCRPAWEAFRSAYVASHLGETARMQMTGGIKYSFTTNDSSTSGATALARLFTGGLIVEGVGGGLANLSGLVTYGCGEFTGYGASNKARIETVAAGATSVICATHAEASRIVADGRWALITGVDLQGYGQPTNPAFFDFCIPTNSNSTTGVITLQSPLKFAYKATWPHLNDGDSGEPDHGGPGTIYPLPASWNTSAEYIKCNIDGNPLGGTGSLGGGVQAINCNLRQVIFTDCESTNQHGINPSGCFLVWFRGGDWSDPPTWEYDKLCNTVVISGTLKQLVSVQSTSIERIIVADTYISALSGMPKELVLTTDSTIDQLISGAAYGAPEVMHWAGTVNTLTAFSTAIWSGVGDPGIDGVSTIAGGVITVPFGQDVNRWAVPGHSYFLVSSDDDRWRVPFRVLDISQTGVTPSGSIQITTDLSLSAWPSWGGPINIGGHPFPEFYYYVGVSDAPHPNGQPLGSYDKRYFSTLANLSNPAHPIYTVGHSGATMNPGYLLGQVVSASINVSAAYAGATSPLTLHWPAVFDNYPITRPDFSRETGTTWKPVINLRATGNRVMVGGIAPTGAQTGDSGLSFPSNEDVWLAGGSGAGASTNLTSESSALAMTIEVTTDHDVVPQNKAMTSFEREQLAAVFAAIPELYDYYPLSSLRPDADDAIGSWKTEADATTNLYQSVDEATAEDTDYIKSASPPDASVARFRMSNPAAGTTLVAPVNVSYRFKKTTSTDQILDVTLKQDSTTVATWQHTGSGLTTAFQTVAQTLTTPQLAAITDFNNLFVEFKASSATVVVAWNPSGAGADLVFSDSNLIATLSGSHSFEYCSAATTKTASGAWYVEFKTVTVTGSAAEHQLFGVNDNAGNYAYKSGATSGAAGTVTSGGTDNITAWASGDVIGWAIDFTNKKAFVSKNGTFNSPQDVAAGTSPAFSWSSFGASNLITLGLDTTIGTPQSVRIQGNSGNQTYSPPTGYTRWDGF